MIDKTFDICLYCKQRVPIRRDGGLADHIAKVQQKKLYPGDKQIFSMQICQGSQSKKGKP